MKCKKQGQRALSWILVTAMMVPSVSVPTIAYAETNQRIATYVGQVPEQLKDDASVKADQFGKAYDTVAVTSKGVRYDVEVVPQELVYYIDNYSSGPLDGTTPAYEAVKELTGTKLKNDAADAVYVEGSWGFHNQNVKTKGNVTTEDKAVSGIYNDQDKLLTYTLPLDAGTYEITTAHYEWWPDQGRTLDITAQIDDGTPVSLGTTGALIVNQETRVTGDVTLDKAGEVTLRIQDTKNKGAILSWLAVAEKDSSLVPFDTALEETDGGLTNRGASVISDAGRGNVVEVTAGWNNQNGGHAEIKDAAALFGRKEFTLLANVKVEDTDTNEDNRNKKAAFSIGTENQNIHIFTQSGKVGYGDSKAGGGISAGNTALEHIIADDWNAMAVSYSEKDGANGSVTVYLNGEKAGEIPDLGFKLSGMSNITAALGRSFATNFLLNGLYDDIVVTSEAMSEEAAAAETKTRMMEPLLSELKRAVAEANAYLDTEDPGNEALKQAVAEADALLAGGNASREAVLAATAKIRNILPVYDAVITIKGSDVDAAALMTNGLTYKGWGLLSCNGTSNLLMDYKAEAPEKYWEMIHTLFEGEHPLISHVKIEMGNDGNTSTAADPATIRYEGEDADVSRSPGWQLAADAKSVNPDVKVSVLRWRSPNWTNGNTNTEKVYEWYRDTIFDAYEKYGIMADYIAAGVNEANYNDAIKISAPMTKAFTKLVEEESDFPDYMEEDAQDAYHRIQFVAADEIDSWGIVTDMYNSKDQKGGTWDSVDAVGIHYVTGTDQNVRDLAQKYNKEIWYSEGCATFGMTSQAERRTDSYVAMGGNQSPLAMVDGYLNSFVFSNMTHYIFQPAIGGFYDGLQYAHKDLVSAREPWAGYVRYDEALYMTAHFTQFSKSGWAADEDNSNGIWLGIPQASNSYAGDNNKNEHLSNEAGKPSYMTLAAPDKSDFSVVAVNNSPKKLNYQIKAEDMNLDENQKLEIWQTKADEYMEFKGEVAANSAGMYTVSVDAGAIATFTTLDYHQNDGDRALTLPEHTSLSDKAVLDTDEDGKMGEGCTGVTDNTILYADDFEYDEEGTVTVNTANGPEQQDYLSSRGNEPRYMMDTHGAWVVEKEDDGNQRLGQILPAAVSEWNGGDPETIVGDYRWMNYKASVDVQADNGYALLGIRQQTGMNSDNSGYNLLIQNGTWKMRKGGSTLLEGSMPEKQGDSCRIALEGRGNAILAYVDGELAGSYIDTDKPYLMGRVFLGSAWAETYFDNLKVEKIPGYIPYATAFYDDHDDEVQYSNDWRLTGPGNGSADNWYRTTSYNKKSGDSTYVTFDGRGTGFMLVGENGGGVKADIYVDGVKKAENAENNSSSKRYSTIVLDGLTSGDHTFKVVVKSGTLVIDGVYILGEVLPGGSIEALKALAAECETYREADYTADYWKVFADALTAAQAVIGNETESTQLEIDTAAIRLQEAKDALLRLDQPVEIIDDRLPEYLAVVEGETVKDDILPAEVRVKLANGTESTAKIQWANNEEDSFSAPYKTVRLKGTVEGGKDLQAVIPVEVVPEDTLYYIDSFSAAPGDGTTPVYEAVRALLGDQLKNEKADQISDGTKWGFNKTGVVTKPDTDLTDKYSSGFYMEGGNPVLYYLPLEAGAYSLTVGVNEWWEPRSMKAVVLADGKELAAENLTLSGKGSQDEKTLSFTLEKADTVTLRVEKVSKNDPVISWLAVAKQPEVLDISGVKVERLPDRTEYRIGEKLDTTGMVVTATMSDATRVELEEDQYTVSTLNSGTPGEKEITVSAAGKSGTVYTDTFRVVVTEEGTEYYTTKIKVTGKPDKMKYYTGDELDTAGMVVKAHQKASPSNAERDIEISDYVTEYDFSKAGKATVEVIYEDENSDGERMEFTDSFTVTVEDEPVEPEYYTTRLRVDKKPKKVVYKVGEEFNPEGMKVMDIQKASPGNATRAVEIPLEELDYQYDFSTSGNKKVKIVYMGTDKNQEEKEFQAAVDVSVADEAEEGFYTEMIQITSQPDQTVYRVGDMFAPAGMAVTAYRINRETGERVEELIRDYKVSPALFMISGDIKVTVSYTGIDKNGDAKVFQDSLWVTVRPASSSDSSGSSDTAEARPVPKPSSTMDGGSWKQDGGSWQYTKPNGQPARNEWGRINGSWYFFKADGRMAANEWMMDADVWYFVDESGAMYENRWMEYGGNWYYLGQSGAMYGNRWLEYNGAWYYLNADGTMAKDTATADGYRVGSDGKWVK